MVSTFVSILSVDKYGRKFLFIEGGIQMSVAQVSEGGLRLRFPGQGVCRGYGQVAEACPCT